VPVALALNIDATVLSLAIPTLSGALHASTAELQWFVAGYTLVFAATMVPGGMLGDRYGRKKLLLAALVLFGIASAACAYAPTAGAFIGARALLGVAAGVATPLTIGVLPVLFPERERGRAVAIVMSATMLAFPIGPILGGWLLSNFWWGWVFLINLPVVAVAFAAVWFLLPESRSSERSRFDGAGVALASAGLATLVYGVIQAGQNGWSNAGAIGEMLAGGVVLCAFVLWERRVTEPLLDLGLFRSPGFTWGTILGATVSFALFGLLFAVPQYFQDVVGVNAMGSGLRLLPMIGGLLAGAGLGDALARRLGPKLTVALGALSAERSGVGSGAIQALRMVGSSFGAAILGSILNSGYRSRLDAAALPPALAHTARGSVVAGVAVAKTLGSPGLLRSVQAAFVHGMGLSLLVSGAVAAVGVPVALRFLPRAAGAAASPDTQSERSPDELAA
jgi:DHA2 family multidrug resistance protein-like MFS transporter